MKSRWAISFLVAGAVAAACSGTDREFDDAGAGGDNEGGDAPFPVQSGSPGSGGTETGPGGAGAGADDSGGQGGQGIAAGFAIATDAERIDVVVGTSTDVVIQIDREAGHDSEIDVIASGLPDGVAVAAATAAATDDSVTLTFAADETATPGGSATITIEASDATTTSTIESRLLVRGPAGSLDTTFGMNGVVSWNGAGEDFNNGRLIVLPDDRLLVGGSVDGNTGQELAVIRFTADGALDKTFATDGVVRRAPGPSFAIAAAFGIRENGTLVLGGYTIDVNLDTNEQTYAAAQLQVTTDGEPDPNFGTAGMRSYDTVFGFEDFNFENGQALFVGMRDFGASDGIGVIGKLDAVGNLDTNFGTGGLLSWPQLVGGMWRVVRDDARYVALASCGEKSCIARFDVAGEGDPTWGIDGVLAFPDATAAPRDMALNAKGQYIMAGTSGADDWLLARVTNTGQILTVTDSFTTGDDNATNLHIDGDAYYVLGTMKKPLNTPNVYAPILVRYDADFQRDETFASAGVLELDVQTTFQGTMDVVQQGDGRLVVATTVRGEGTLRLYRIWN